MPKPESITFTRFQPNWVDCKLTEPYWPKNDLMSSSERSGTRPPTKILPCLALAFLGSTFLLLMTCSPADRTWQRKQVIDSSTLLMNQLCLAQLNHLSVNQLSSKQFSSRTGMNTSLLSLITSLIGYNFRMNLKVGKSLC